MSDISTEEFLAHFGVKGMRWGVRNEPRLAVHPRGHVIIKGSTRADRKWQKNVYSYKGAVAVHNRVADLMNNEILDKFNNKIKYKGHTMFDEEGSLLTGPKQDKVTQAYFKEYNREIEGATKRAYKDIYGVSPSGKFRAIEERNDRGQWVTAIRKVDAQHADVPWKDLVMEIELDSLGHIIKISNIKTFAKHSSNEAQEFLSHFGIKGMRWGVINRRFNKPDTPKQKQRKISQDYRKTRQLRKRPPPSLSNRQLELVNKRLNLEQKYRKLNPTKVDKGKEFAKFILPALGVTASFAGIIESDIGQKAIKWGKAFVQNKQLRYYAKRGKLF